jgi:hypothetical protein
MKVRIEGKEVEGTPAEMKRFLQLVSKEEEAAVPDEQMQEQIREQWRIAKQQQRLRDRQRSGKGRMSVQAQKNAKKHDWSPEEKRFLLDCCAEGYDRDETIERVVRRTGRSHSAVMGKWYALQRSGGLPKLETVVAMPTEKPVSGPPAGIAQYEALFPELGVADRKVAFQIFRHAAVTRNTLNYANDAYPLGIESIEQWNLFCEDVVLRSEAIAKAIGFAPRLTRVGRSATVSFDEVAAT